MNILFEKKKTNLRHKKTVGVATVVRLATTVKVLFNFCRDKLDFFFLILFT